jgi:HAD superfamily hydrolase (TIGR01509 family)
MTRPDMTRRATDPHAPTADPDAAGTGLPAAVLWDMDGTLVDTEPYWFEAESALIAAHGGTWSPEHARNLVGSALPAAGEYIRLHAGVDLTGEQIVDHLLDAVTARVGDHVPWRSGARELLTRLVEDGVPCALVTMSYRRLAEAVVAGLPRGTFTTVIAGDDVTHGKPHPEPYLTAAARLGVPPGSCVAIEDSPTGVASAEAAGMPVLAVEHLVPLPPGPRRRVLSGFDGVTPADLTRLLTDLRGPVRRP